MPGLIVSLRICRRSARILPRAAGRYGFAAPAAVWCPGPGIINLSLAWRCSSRSAKPPNRSIIRCARCCSVPSRASALPATPGGERFLCDGRYNLACGEGAETTDCRTAQYWRPLAAGGGRVVLAHAVIRVTPIRRGASGGERLRAQLGSERVYCFETRPLLSFSCAPGKRHLLFPLAGTFSAGAGRSSLKVAPEVAAEGFPPRATRAA